MKLVHTGRAMLGGMALCLLSLGSVSAGQIATPALFLGDADVMTCKAINMINTVTRVTVRIFRSDGNTGPAVQICDLAANFGANNNCEVTLTGAGGWCRISVNGLTNAEVRERIRGRLQSFRTTPPFRTDAVVEAQ
jgi:hypothetical protein